MGLGGFTGRCGAVLSGAVPSLEPLTGPGTERASHVSVTTMLLKSPLPEGPRKRNTVSVINLTQATRRLQLQSLPPPSVVLAAPRFHNLSKRSRVSLGSAFSSAPRLAEVSARSGTGLTFQSAP